MPRHELQTSAFCFASSLERKDLTQNAVRARPRDWELLELVWQGVPLTQDTTLKKCTATRAPFQPVTTGKPDLALPGSRAPAAGPSHSSSRPELTRKSRLASRWLTVGLLGAAGFGTSKKWAAELSFVVGQAAARRTMVADFAAECMYASAVRSWGRSVRHSGVRNPHDASRLLVLLDLPLHRRHVWFRH